jgi:hypothetical protein
MIASIVIVAGVSGSEPLFASRKKPPHHIRASRVTFFARLWLTGRPNEPLRACNSAAVLFHDASPLTKTIVSEFTAMVTIVDRYEPISRVPFVRIVTIAGQISI